MKPRTRLGVATATAMALTLLGWTATGSGAGKPQEITADLSFRNAPDDMITGGPATARILSSNGSLFLDENDETGHHVGVSFDSQTSPAPSPFNCKEWGDGKKFSWPMAPADDLSAPRVVQIATLNQYGYTSTYGWAPSPGVSGSDQNSQIPNVSAIGEAVSPESTASHSG